MPRLNLIKVPHRFCSISSPVQVGTSVHFSSLYGYDNGKSGMREAVRGKSPSPSLLESSALMSHTGGFSGSGFLPILESKGYEGERGGGGARRLMASVRLFPGYDSSISCEKAKLGRDCSHCCVCVVRAGKGDGMLAVSPGGSGNVP